MKKIFLYLSLAAMAFGLVSCVEEEKIDWDKVTVNGFYVAGPATGSDEIKSDCVMAAGFNEVDKAVRDGMFEKYIVLEANKDFYLLYNDGGNKSRYSAELKEFTTPLEEAYSDNPASVMKGSLVVGNDAPAMKVSKTGLYHIVLDINKAGDLKEAQILLLDASDFGVRGGMNGWGFTSSDPKVTEFSNDGVTFTFKDQELGKGGEFKFATGNYWKVTLDDAGKVKAEVSLAEGMTLNGGNIKVDKGGTYDITLTFKLAQGSFDKSFSYTAVCTKESTAPETMYMNGGQWGGESWDWSAPGIVELVPVWGAPGYFWCTRWFDGAQEFKFCAKKEWNGDFGDNGANCKVPESGFYTVLVNGNENTVEIKPAEVYVIGLCGTAKTDNQDVWDFGGADVLKFAPDGQVLKATLASSAELRLASKVQPNAAIEGVTTGNGWIDWWKTEFIFFDGKIAYRGAGNDQDRVQGEAGKTVVLDFNNGTVTIEEGAVGGPIKTADAFIAWMANPTADAELAADITLPETYVPGEFVGTFNGNGHTVTYNLNVPADATYNSGLFSKVTGTVKNLKVAGTLTSVAANAANVGGIAGATGDDGALFENCESSVVIATPVKASFRTGGIVGLGGKNLTLKNCVNNGEISHIVPDMGSANAIQEGGIVGHLEATGSVIGCTNNGKLIFSGKGTPRIGGMCGYFNVLEEGLFENCTNNADIEVASNAESGYNYVGGISGYYGTPVNASHVAYKNCVNKGNIVHTAGVAKTSDRFGGILCHCGGTAVDVNQPLSVEVIDCSNSGNLICSGNTAKNHIGGIVGFTETITCIIKCSGCTNTGSITVEGNGSIGSMLGYSCNPASTFENFTVGKDVVMKGGASANAGIVIGSGYVSTDAIPNAELSTALTGKVEGGKIVKGEEVTELNTENYKIWIAPRGFVGSVDGVTFTGSAPSAPSIKLDGNLSDWDAIDAIPGKSGGSIKEWKYATDAESIYFYAKVDRSDIKAAKAEDPAGSGKYPFNWRRYFYIGIDTDNNASTPTASAPTSGDFEITGCEVLALVYPFRGNATSASGTDGAEVVNGVDEQGWIKLNDAKQEGKMAAWGVIDNDFGYLEMSLPKASIGSPTGTMKIQLSLSSNLSNIDTIEIK